MRKDRGAPVPVTARRCGTRCRSSRPRLRPELACGTRRRRRRPTRRPRRRAAAGPAAPLRHARDARRAATPPSARARHRLARRAARSSEKLRRRDAAAAALVAAAADATAPPPARGRRSPRRACATGSGRRRRRCARPRVLAAAASAAEVDAAGRVRRQPRRGRGGRVRAPRLRGRRRLRRRHVAVRRRRASSAPTRRDASGRSQAITTCPGLLIAGGTAVERARRRMARSGGAPVAPVQARRRCIYLFCVAGRCGRLKRAGLSSPRRARLSGRRLVRAPPLLTPGRAAAPARRCRSSARSTASRVEHRSCSVLRRARTLRARGRRRRRRRRRRRMPPPGCWRRAPADMPPFGTSPDVAARADDAARPAEAPRRAPWAANKPPARSRHVRRRLIPAAEPHVGCARRRRPPSHRP